LLEGFHSNLATQTSAGAAVLRALQTALRQNIAATYPNVCFTPESGLHRKPLSCPLSANSGTCLERQAGAASH